VLCRRCSAVAATAVAAAIERGAGVAVACNRRHKLTIAQTTATATRRGGVIGLESRIPSATGVYSTFVRARFSFSTAATTGRNSYLHGRVKRVCVYVLSSAECGSLLSQWRNGLLHGYAQPTTTTILHLRG